jgi:membrane protein DedA with SNARE-associated domain
LVRIRAIRRAGWDEPVTTPAETLSYPAQDPRPRLSTAAFSCCNSEGHVLGFIDTAVFPILKDLYAAVGYLGVFIMMVLESTIVPIPSELILPFAGYEVSIHEIEPLTHSEWSFWIVVIVGVAANTVGSFFGYLLGARLGRPFLDRWGKFLLVRPHEVDQAEHFFARWGAPTAFFSRLLPGIRTIISFVAGVSHMPIRRFLVYSTLGAIPWTIALVWAGVQLGDNWRSIRDTLKPFDNLILVACILAVVLFVWYRLDRPGWPRGKNAAA